MFMSAAILNVFVSEVYLRVHLRCVTQTGVIAVPDIVPATTASATGDWFIIVLGYVTLSS